jgi:hypothetical protein
MFFRLQTGDSLSILCACRAGSSFSVGAFVRLGPRSVSSFESMKLGSLTSVFDTCLPGCSLSIRSITRIYLLRSFNKGNGIT